MSAEALPNSDLIPTFDESMNIIKKSMEVLGIWPEDSKIKDRYYILKKLSILVQYATMCGFLVSQWGDLYVCWGDIDAMTDNLSNHIITVNALVKLSYLVIRSQNIKEVIETMRLKWDDVTKFSIMEQRDLLLENSQIAWSLIKKYLIFMAFAVALYISMPVIHSREGATIGVGYPFRAYYFFGQNSKIGYGFFYAGQVLVSFTVGSVSCAIDSFFSIAIYHFAAQLRILQNKLEKVGTDGNDAYEQVTVLIRRHKMDIRDVGKLESIISATSLQQLMSSCVFICVTGFKLIVTLKRGMIFSVIMYFVFMIVAIIQIFMYCYSGQELITQSMRIGDAAYNSMWCNLSPSSQQNFKLIILRAQRPLACTAMNVYDLSLPNFTAILKTAGSFMSLLNAVYKEE